LQKNNIEVLQEQLKQTRDRFQVGEVTRTDVAQAEASLAQGQSAAFSAQSNLQASLATYRQLIGVDPKNLAPAKSIDGIVPLKIDEAINSALTEHPSVLAALYNVDALTLAVKINQGQLLPTISVTGSLAKNYDYTGIPDYRVLNGSVVGTLSVPLYEGGAVYASVRQAKEQLAQAQLQADLAREQIRAGVVSTWGNFQNTKFVIEANKSAVRAAEIALNGVREEAKVGQRTTLDVLNAQQVLLQARVSLVTSQRDQVVNSYSLTQAVGRLSADRLGLKVTTYDPTVHYEAVRDKWIGLRTPDGN
jgi:outer membrane protein